MPYAQCPLTIVAGITFYSYMYIYNYNLTRLSGYAVCLFFLLD